MTLNDIIVAALHELDRTSDSKSLDIWRDKFTRYANEAARRIADGVGLTRTDSVSATGGLIDTDALTRPCLRVVSVTQDSRKLPFGTDSATGNIRVYRHDAQKSVQVCYRYMPRDMSSVTDEPEVPRHTQHLIPLYVVWRERMSGDVPQQQGARLYGEVFEDGLRFLRPHMGGASAHAIINRY